MTHTTGDVIRMAGHLLDSRERRCVKTLTADSSGTPCMPNDPKVSKWCYYGAISACENALLMKIVSVPLEVWIPTNVWDDASCEYQDYLVEQLKNYNGD